MVMSIHVGERFSQVPDLAHGQEFGNYHLLPHFLQQSSFALFSSDSYCNALSFGWTSSHVWPKPFVSLAHRHIKIQCQIACWAFQRCPFVLLWVTWQISTKVAEGPWEQPYWCLKMEVSTNWLHRLALPTPGANNLTEIFPGGRTSTAWELPRCLLPSMGWLSSRFLATCLCVKPAQYLVRWGDATAS